jgi:hypothetical protein
MKLIIGQNKIGVLNVKSVVFNGNRIHICSKKKKDRM